MKLDENLLATSAAVTAAIAAGDSVGATAQVLERLEKLVTDRSGLTSSTGLPSTGPSFRELPAMRQDPYFVQDKPLSDGLTAHFRIHRQSAHTSEVAQGVTNQGKVLVGEWHECWVARRGSGLEKQEITFLRVTEKIADENGHDLVVEYDENGVRILGSGPQVLRIEKVVFKIPENWKHSTTSTVTTLMGGLPSSGQGVAIEANGAIFLRPAEIGVKVSLLPIEVESKDRFLTGAFDTSIDLFQSAQVDFKNPSSGENLGSYKLDGSGGTHIYESKDDIFSEQELDGVVGGSVGAGSNKLNQKVVFWKDGSKVRFATTFEGIGSVEISLSKSDGTSLGKITHALKADSNFSGLINHLASRIDSIDGPATDPFVPMPEVTGVPDDDDDPLPVLVAAAGATAASPPPAEAATNNSWSATTRNLLSKVLIATRSAVDGIKTGAEYTYKVGGGFIKGYVDGVCDGVKSDVTGVAELAMMALESVTGDFHRAKAMYDGIKTLASMTSEERGAVFDSMLVKFVDKSTTAVPWDPSEMNGADDWGISAYMAGYGGGFITEQIVVIMAGAGLVSKVGQGVKVALLGTKLGQITVAMCKGVRQFISASFLSISKHVKVYGEKAVRSVRGMVQEVAHAHRNGKTLGEHFYEFMERITPVKLTFQFVADQKAVIYKTADDWLKIGGTGTTIECALAADLGVNLTEHGMKGFLNLWKGALRDGVNGHYMHHLKNVCTAGNTLGAQGLGKILEMFESTSQSVFKFTPDAQDLAKWTSPGGIVYLAKSKEGHRIMHILTHTVPGYKAGTHSVFSVAREQVFKLIDDAWAKPHLIPYKADGVTVDASAFVVNMGNAVGTGGQQMIRIAFEGSEAQKIIRSAYPVFSQTP